MEEDEYNVNTVYTNTHYAYIYICIYIYIYVYIYLSIYIQKLRMIPLEATPRGGEFNYDIFDIL
jgi:hypothetical protein